MKIRSAFSNVLPVPQEFTEPSITQPDLSYSIEQLVSDYSVGALPSLSQLQHYLDDDPDDDNLVDDDSADLRFSDRAEALESFLQANHIRRSIFEKVKKMHEFNRKKRDEELEMYRKRYGSIQEDIIPES